MEIRSASRKEAALIDHLLKNKESWLYGYGITKNIDIKSGVLYPILGRFKEAGFLEEQQETINGRNRKLYKLSELGLIKLPKRLEKHRLEQEFREYEQDFE